MKKIMTLVGASMFLASSVLAGGMIGIKLGTGDLEATKNSYTAGSNTYAAQTKSESEQFGAIFAEISLPQVEGLSLGVEYIPFTATVSVDGNSSDSHLELSEHTTLYGLYMKDMGDVNAFFKAGYAMADIGNVKANYATTTVNSNDSSLEGPMIGIGVQTEIASEVIARLEATHTMFDDVSVTTSTASSLSVTKTGEADLTTVSVSLAKSF